MNSNYQTYLKIGSMFQYKKEYENAIHYYLKALNEPQNGTITKKMVKELIKECEDENNERTSANK